LSYIFLAGKTYIYIRGLLGCAPGHGPGGTGHRSAPALVVASCPENSNNCQNMTGFRFFKRNCRTFASQLKRIKKNEIDPAFLKKKAVPKPTQSARQKNQRRP
jgi:hypothetical protein